MDLPSSALWHRHSILSTYVSYFMVPLFDLRQFRNLHLCSNFDDELNNIACEKFV